MKPLSERDENSDAWTPILISYYWVGMKPLSERDENLFKLFRIKRNLTKSRNEATL